MFQEEIIGADCVTRGEATKHSPRGHLGGGNGHNAGVQACTDTSIPRANTASTNTHGGISAATRPRCDTVPRK